MPVPNNNSNLSEVELKQTQLEMDWNTKCLRLREDDQLLERGSFLPVIETALR